MTKNILEIKKRLANCTSEKESLQQIISLSKQIKNLSKDECLEENRIKGCQSELYLTHKYEGGKLQFFIYSEALISKGLASLLILLYNDKEPKTLFLNPPTIFQEIPALQKISINRQLGIQNLFKAMQKIASKYI